MSPIQEFLSIACVALQFAALCFVIKIYHITVMNWEPRVEGNHQQQPVAATRRRNVSRTDEDNQNYSVLRNRQIPREHDERQGY